MRLLHFVRNDTTNDLMKKIVLASASPRRKKLLEQIGLIFIVDPSNIEEKLNPRLKPKSQAERLSLQKAKAVAKKYQSAILISADTFVVFGNEIMGKPESLKDAKRMIQKLSGKKHKVITGFTILDTQTEKKITKSVETTVYMRKLSKKEIDGYISSAEPLGKAGAYAIQEKGGVLVKHIEGDFFNIVGLPIFKVVEELKKFGISIL